MPKILEPNVIAPSKNYQHRQVRPLGVGGEAEPRLRIGLLQEEEEKSMKQAQERLGENSSIGNTIIVNKVFWLDLL